MKGVYWRPRKVSRAALVAIAVAALGGLAAVELLPSRQRCDHRQQKLAAARLAERGMELIKEERLRRGHRLTPHFDPAGTGLIGDSMTLVTSVPGNLKAKQTSLNPNFAAAVVQMLHDAGVREGDVVAVGCSGSFPALNLSVYAALGQHDEQVSRADDLVHAWNALGAVGQSANGLRTAGLEYCIYAGNPGSS